MLFLFWVVFVYLVWIVLLCIVRLFYFGSWALNLNIWILFIGSVYICVCVCVGFMWFWILRFWFRSFGFECFIILSLCVSGVLNFGSLSLDPEFYFLWCVQGFCVLGRGVSWFLDVGFWISFVDIDYFTSCFLFSRIVVFGSRALCTVCGTLWGCVFGYVFFGSWFSDFRRRFYFLGFFGSWVLDLDLWILCLELVYIRHCFVFGFVFPISISGFWFLFFYFCIDFLAIFICLDLSFCILSLGSQGFCSSDIDCFILFLWIYYFWILSFESGFLGLMFWCCLFRHWFLFVFFWWGSRASDTDLWVVFVDQLFAFCFFWFVLRFCVLCIHVWVLFSGIVFVSKIL